MPGPGVMVHLPDRPFHPAIFPPSLPAAAVHPFVVPGFQWPYLPGGFRFPARFPIFILAEKPSSLGTEIVSSPSVPKRSDQKPEPQKPHPCKHTLHRRSVAFKTVRSKQPSKQNSGKKRNSDALRQAIWLSLSDLELDFWTFAGGGALCSDAGTVVIVRHGTGHSGQQFKYVCVCVCVV